MAAELTADAASIVWRLELAAPPERVFELLSTDAGRASFWAERTVQDRDVVMFHFPNGETLESRILEATPPRRLVLSYFDATTVSFELRPAGAGTELVLHESGVPEATIHENRAGWVSVLLALKAQADHGVDLRNHDPARTWSQGYVDN